VKCWGWNIHGEVGDGTTTDRDTPVDVIGLSSGVARVWAGHAHACAEMKVGGYKCWGWNTSGQLGDGTLVNRSIPVDVIGLTGATTLSLGFLGSCALMPTGGVKCWGDDTLTNGTASAVPVDSTGFTSGWKSIAVGISHLCAVSTAGGVKCKGLNANGELGVGTTTSSSTAADVVGLTAGVVAVAAGENHTCALTTAGGVKCWGDNSEGQLGNGLTSMQTTPVDVSGLSSGIVGVATKGNHTCALPAIGGVKCWGNNALGQLGNQ
jgi:alpha-tubulin suppressor-like RCC1 family protein